MVYNEPNSTQSKHGTFQVLPRATKLNVKEFAILCNGKLKITKSQPKLIAQTSSHPIFRMKIAN